MNSDKNILIVSSLNLKDPNKLVTAWKLSRGYTIVFAVNDNQNLTLLKLWVDNRQQNYGFMRQHSP